ncbi:histidine kinase [Stenotrophomonas sp. GZD-301]|uniref:sensor histidine kinase n=1 Tax=Stenotrophomonas sp. GZD-301 TaxID=3404814 RepID=UPI003BB51676
MVAHAKRTGVPTHLAHSGSTARPTPHVSTPPSSDVRTLVTRLIPLLLGCLVGQLLPAVAQMPGLRLHVLWLPGPLLLAWLLFTPRAAWRGCVLSAAGGTLLAVVFVPFVAMPRLLATFVEFALVLIVAWLLQRGRARRAPLEGYRDIALFLLMGVVLLPLCSAWCQTLLITGGGDTAGAGTLLTLILCNSVSYLLLVPMLVNVERIVHTPERRVGWHWRTLTMALVLMGALAAVWSMDWSEGVITPLLALAPIPLLVWALIVFGVAGASVAMLVVAVLGMQLSLEGLGPFALWNAERSLVTAQVWSLGSGAALLFLGALSEQKLSNHLQLQQAYRRLGEVTGRMLVVQEEERTRIARDLHDDVNQSLAAISIRLSALRNQVPPSERPSVVELQEQLLSVSNDIRSISHELHPSILRFTGLASALDAFCIKRNTRGALRLRCHIDDPPRLPDDQELSLFRIVQEAINNVDRHARASVADVLVTVRAGEWLLRIDDDGVGMPTACRSQLPPGLGMISMEERAHLLGGTLQVTRSPLGGTRVEVRFPLR